MDCRPPGTSVHGILQARILERVTTLSSAQGLNPGLWQHRQILYHLSHQCSLVGRTMKVTWGTTLVVQWVGLHASMALGGGGVARVCSLIWELVSRTLLSVVKGNRITRETLKHLHSPRQKKKILSFSLRNVICVCLSAGPRFLFSSRSPNDSNVQPEMGNISF